MVSGGRQASMVLVLRMVVLRESASSKQWLGRRGSLIDG